MTQTKMFGYHAMKLEELLTTLCRTERCCSSVNDVLLTNVCNSDGTGCVSLVLKSRPKDCGDGDSSIWNTRAARQRRLRLLARGRV